jgi:hypothetical protein
MCIRATAVSFNGRVSLGGPLARPTCGCRCHFAPAVAVPADGSAPGLTHVFDAPVSERLQGGDTDTYLGERPQPLPPPAMALPNTTSSLPLPSITEPAGRGPILNSGPAAPITMVRGSPTSGTSRYARERGGSTSSISSASSSVTIPSFKAAQLLQPASHQPPVARERSRGPALSDDGSVAAVVHTAVSQAVTLSSDYDEALAADEAQSAANAADGSALLYSNFSYQVRISINAWRNAPPPFRFLRPFKFLLKTTSPFIFYILLRHRTMLCGNRRMKSALVEV